MMKLGFVEARRKAMAARGSMPLSVRATEEQKIGFVSVFNVVG